MRKRIITLLLLCLSISFYAQTNSEISSVYIKRAQRHLEKIEYREALEEFNKAMKYASDSIANSNVAWLGAYINFELKNYNEARKYAKKYFVLQKDKKSEEYEDLLEVYVSIEEKIQEQIEEENKKELERLRKEKEKRRIDSLKSVWKSKSEELSFKADSIFPFNKFNKAIYRKDGKYGIVKENGDVIVAADTYESVKSFDGFTLLLDKKNEPRKLYIYNHSKEEGHLAPSPTEFNAISTNYGNVMLPRANGKIVAYPNNSLKAMVYDALEKKMLVVENQKDLFRELRKTDKIQKSNNDGQVKVNKEWYYFGGDLGAGVYPLFAEDYSLRGYLSSVDGSFLDVKTHPFVGAYFDGNYQLLHEDTTSWMNQNGTKIEAPKNAFGTYSGKVKAVKKGQGVYQLMVGDTIILGTKELEKLSDFIEKHSPAVKS